MKMLWKLGTAALFRVLLMDTTSFVGAGKTGLTFASSNLNISAIADNEAAPTVYTSLASTIETVTTLGTYTAPTSGKCRFREVDPVNLPGVYEIHLTSGRWGVAGSRSLLVGIQADGIALTYAEMELTSPANNLLDADIGAILADANAAQAFYQSSLAIARGSIASATSTVLTVASIVPALTDVSQLAGRILIFDRATTTTGLRGQAAIIQANTTGAGPTITVLPALTSVPAAGDMFGVY